MKFKNSNCDETQKLKLGWNSKTQSDETQKLKCDETQKLKLWQNLKPQIVMKLRNSNCDETQLKLSLNSRTQIITKTPKLKL